MGLLHGFLSWVFLNLIGILKKCKIDIFQNFYPQQHLVMTLPTHKNKKKFFPLSLKDQNIAYVRLTCFLSQEKNGIARFPKWNVGFTCIVGYSRKNSKNEDMEFPGVLKSIWKFQVSNKKECNFHLIKKKSCRISMGLGFWSWNSQELQYNFMEFPEAKLFFLESIPRIK